MPKRLSSLLLGSALTIGSVTGCDTGKSEAEQCLADAEGQTSEAVLRILEADADCVSFSVESEPAAGGGIVCIAAADGSYWALEAVTDAPSYIQFCGLNGATQIECVESGYGDANSVTCESVISIE